MNTHGRAARPGRTLLLITVAAGVVIGFVALAALIAPELAPIILAVGLLVDVALLAVLYLIQVRRHW